MCCYLKNVCVYVYEYVYGQMCILQKCSRICVVTWRMCVCMSMSICTAKCLFCNNVLVYVLLPGDFVCVCVRVCVWPNVYLQESSRTPLRNHAFQHKAG
jgi:hypothetical protein